MLIQLPPSSHHSLFWHVLWEMMVSGISNSCIGKNHSWPRQLFLKLFYATEVFYLMDRKKRDSKNLRHNLSRFWRILLLVGIKVDLKFFFRVSKNTNHGGNLWMMEVSQFEGDISSSHKSYLCCIEWTVFRSITIQLFVYNDKYG